MTADYVAFNAIERPDAPAFIDNGRRFTYAQFDRDIRTFIPALHLARLSPIPRNAGGKIQRDQLKRILARAIDLSTCRPSVMIPKFACELRNLNHTSFNRLVARSSLKFVRRISGAGH